MQLTRGLLFVLLLAWPAAAQLGGFKPKAHTQARLLLSHESVRPGETVLAGVELSMATGWHTYWQNPGDSGEETKVYWALPPQLSAGPIEWPTPEKLVAEDMTTFVYHGRVVLLIPLTIASNAAAGPRDLSALVRWLECETSCIPASNMVSATLTIGVESKPGADAAVLAEAQRKLPSKQVPGTAVARWDANAAPAKAGTPNDAKRGLLVEWNTEAQEPDFFPYTNAVATVSAKTEVLPGSAGKAVLRKMVEKNDSTWPQQVSGLLVRKENGARVGYEAVMAIGGAGETEKPAKAGTPSGGGKKPIWFWLGYAFLGGLILNIMPCVLPVIALKILGFVAQSREHPQRVRMLGTLYGLGVLASFLVLAGIVIGVKAAGQKAGWGMQFSNPQFIVILTIIVTLVALNLFGVFEVTLSGRTMTAASEAASRHGTGGAFMNGVLATVLATPCSAPFLGAALGFAFVQSASVIVLFFVTIGLGLAMPYLILSWNPKWLKVLPKPGAWMERFKVAMGFPMLATAAWLMSLTLPFYGDRFWWLGIFLVMVGLAAWVFGEFFQRGTKRRGLAIVVMLLLLIGGFAGIVEGQLQWRTVVKDSVAGDETFQLEPGGVVWRKWSTNAVARFRNEKRPILVDFTAKWCITCNTVVKPSIESDRVRQKLKEIDAVALLADYTKYPPEISAELERFERAAVPLVVVYPKDPNKQPIVLPEVVTPTIIAAALDEAVR